MGTSEVVGVVEIEGGRVVAWCSPWRDVWDDKGGLGNGMVWAAWDI